MLRKCELSGAEFEVPDKDREFYQILSVPAPRLQPLERQRQRVAFRNFRNLYRRRCDGTGKMVISMYDTDVPFPVFDTSYWWTDNWDPYSFGTAINFDRPFFEQYADLARRVPRFSIMNVQSDNCSYSNFALDSRNCYLVFGCVRNEDCQYGHIVWDCKDCFDNLYAYRSEWCSNCVDIVGCYNVHFSSESVHCSDSYFLYDCRNCRDCFGCFNLRGKQYCFFNEQLSQQDYQRRIRVYQPLSHATIRNCQQWLSSEAKVKAVYPPFFGEKFEEVSGNHIFEGKNLEYCFDAKQCEDSKYLFTAFGIENCYDISFSGAPARFCYNSLTLAHCEEVICSQVIQNSRNIAYSEFCFSSHDLFGCIGLRNAAYCIFNRQYSREDFFQLRTQLVAGMQSDATWGEFFPMQHSPFAYNESIAQEYMPLTEEQTLARGLRWRSELGASANSAESYAVPETITLVTDDVLALSICCESSQKHFKINSKELAFYRQLNLPIPRECPDIRHERRMQWRVKRDLTQQSCAKCHIDFPTPHESVGGRRLLCQKCYQGQLYGGEATS